MRKIVYSFVVFLAVLISCTDEMKQPAIKFYNDFNAGWKFFNKDIPGAEKPDFNDSDWRAVDLPHDWSVEDYPVQDSLHVGPFYRDQAGGADVGYLRGGTGWYRKTFSVPETELGKQVILYFDGVQTESEVFVNGRKAGEHVYGYTPFYFNITSLLDSLQTDNLVAVKVVNPENNSRWFAGAGIYRNVSIAYLDPVHIDVWGVFVRTLDINEDGADLAMDIDLVNSLKTDVDLSVRVQLLSPNGLVSTLPLTDVNLAAGETHSLTVDTQVADPLLWDTEAPNLYTARIELLCDHVVVDRRETLFGIRTLAWSADRGFLLNGKSVLLKGGCMHHDNGLVGAAAFPRAEARRVAIMKQNGFNAIRTSHNPPSAAFLDACDRLGVLVIDESFDMWHKSKRPNDYSNHYRAWWEKDTKAMVLRDRNHPSVVMWSIGNEIQERADKEGLEIAKAAYDLIKSLDKSRPITMAVCDFWDNKHLQWDDSAPAFALLDIGGYNYQWERYTSDHDKYPDRLMVGTESIALQAFENWNMVKSQPYVIGDFVWTGMDYIGESGIGNAIYPEPDAEKTFLMPWPYYISWCGDIDIIGNKKPQSYYRDVVWDESNLELAVHEPNPAGKKEVVSFWGWPNEVQSWNWEGHEGDSLQVSVYSSWQKVRLELNGKTIAEMDCGERNQYKSFCMVSYEQGTLTVHGLEDGQIVESKSISTTGNVSELELVPELADIPANRNEIVYVHVRALDEHGMVVPNANIDVHSSVRGAGELIAAGNGSPEMDGSIQDNNFSLFRGKGIIIIRSSGEPGNIDIDVSSGDRLNNKTLIKAVK